MSTPPPSPLKRAAQWTLIALLLLLLFIPFLQHAAQWPTDKPLGGFRRKYETFPTWTKTSWLDGTFAATVNEWTREGVGIRGWLICFNRQLRYECFGQVEPSPLRKRSLVIGTPPELYENILVIDALRPPQITPAQMDDFGKRIARTQELLKQQGKAFLVIIAPNKAILYPEALPSWARHRASETNSDYRTFVAALEHHQIPYLDSLALFRELRPEFPELVPMHAIHWSNHGVWIAWQHAVPRINAQHILPELPIPETEELIWEKPTKRIQELLGQLNMFRAPHYAPKLYAFPVAAPIPQEAAGTLRALIVGDSFGAAVMDAMSRSRLCSDIDYWYYMQSERTAPEPSFDSRAARTMLDFKILGELRKNIENGHKMLDDKNLVVFVITTFNIDKSAWGFDRLVEQLYGDPSAPPSLTYNEEIEPNLSD